MRRTRFTVARFAVGWLAVVCALAACEGDGSDIGPSLPRLPNASCKVLVLDAAGRGVSGARVMVGGAVAPTGRSGRGDLFADPRGRLLVTVDAAAASSTDASSLASIAFASTLPGVEITQAVFLPDLAASAGLTLDAGTLAATAVLDDLATSGARLDFPGGASVGIAGGASAVLVRTGAVGSHQLPGDLPPAPAGAQLPGRGIFVDAPGATFTPGADLEVVDDLAVPPGGLATLWWLDPDTGEWAVRSASATSTGGRLRSPGAVTRGGFYVFTAAVPAVVTVRGRIVDAAVRGVGEALLRVGEANLRSNGDGTFVVAGLAATDASAAPRTLAIDVHGGSAFLPVGIASSADLVAGGTVDVGDLRLDTLLSANVRILVLRRGRVEPLRRFALSSVDGAMAGATIAGADGQTLIEDVPTQYFGFSNGFPFDVDTLFVAQDVGFLEDRLRWVDLRQFYDERNWYTGSRNTSTRVVDAAGGGPVRGAGVTRGLGDGIGFAGFTQENGILVINREFDGRATASVQTSRDGRSLTSAFTIERPNGESLDLPLVRLLRAPGGAFDRHGLVQGSVLGSTGQALRLKTTRQLEFDEWFDDVFAGVPTGSALPVRVDPASGGTAFAAGVATPAGNLAIVEGETAVFRLLRLGILRDLAVAEARITARDLDLSHAATATFTVPDGVRDLLPALAGNLAFDLAWGASNGLVVDVARGVGGSHRAVGNDLEIDLPPLVGDLAGGQWLLAFGGSDPVLAQRSLLRLAGAGSGVEAAVPFVPVPDVLEPSDGATVPAAGFTVRYSVPPGVRYMTIELRSDLPADTKRWQVVVPPDLTEFRFWTLPAEAVTPLVAGRSYRLTVAAHRALGGPLAASPDYYRDVTTFWQTIGAGDRGIDGVASRSLTVHAN